MTAVFVYGTLKKGHRNHDRYLHDAVFLGEAVTLDKFDMVDVGFPVILPQKAAEAYTVLGEVYRVMPNQLQRMDSLEQVGRMYTRQVRSVRLLITHKIVQANVYVGIAGIWSETRPVEPDILWNPDEYLHIRRYNWGAHKLAKAEQDR